MPTAREICHYPIEAALLQGKWQSFSRFRQIRPGGIDTPELLNVRGEESRGVCLTRAIAPYLAQDSGRRYRTLFSDETDGPLDSERQRMFMAMKREVLRLGGYRPFATRYRRTTPAVSSERIMRELLAQVARAALQVTQHDPLARFLRPSVTKLSEYVRADSDPRPFAVRMVYAAASGATNSRAARQAFGEGRK